MVNRGTRFSNTPASITSSFCIVQRSTGPDRPWRQEGGQGPAGAAGSGISTCPALPGNNSSLLLNSILVLSAFMSDLMCEVFDHIALVTEDGLHN